MDTGMIASRYATALLRFVEENGSADIVAMQARRLEKTLLALPQLRHVLEDPSALTAEGKISMLKSTVGEDTMHPDFVRFLNLVLARGRISFLRFILRSFIEQYCKGRNLRVAHLRMVQEPTPAFLSEIRDLVKKRTGLDLIIETELDPSLIGGFVFDIEDYMLDASVSHQLDLVRRQFEYQNRRIV